MPSTQAKFATILIKTLLSNWFHGTIEEQRKRAEASTRFIPKSRQVNIKNGEFGGVDGAWFVPKNLIHPDRVILYLHGGAYALGSVQGSRDLISRLALACGCSVLALDYRLAPEHPFPAALEDAIKAWTWLTEVGWNPSKLLVAGDSAGGGLAVALSLWLKDQKAPQPAGIVGFSPWLDLTLSGPSIQNRAQMDPDMKAEPLALCAKFYAGELPLNHPLISPLYADLVGLSPVLFQSGRDDILLDDTRRFIYQAKTAGIKAKMDIYSGLFHVFQTLGFLPETKESLNRVAFFFDAQVAH